MASTQAIDWKDDLFPIPEGPDARFQPIKDFCSNFYRVSDDNDTDAWVNLFTEKAVVQIDEEQEARGKTGKYEQFYNKISGSDRRCSGGS